MPLKQLPVWPFEPNWTSSVGETLEWKTDILQSPSGSEQRRSLRILPRRTIDYTVAAEGDERSLLDNLLATFSAQEWYLPIWYDVRITTAQATATFIPCPVHGFAVGMPIFVAGDSVYDYQITEITALSATGMTVSPALVAPPTVGGRIFPMTVGRLIEEPSQTVITDSLTTAEPQFLLTEYPTVTPPPPRDAGPLILNGLITNAYHPEVGRGGYFHENSGTSEGQFIVIYSLFLSYEALIGGTAEQQMTARYYKMLAQQMLDAMGPGDGYIGPMLRQPIPTDVNTITLMHWLFAGRGDIPGQEIILSYETTASSGRIRIPVSAGGDKVFKVWQIYPGSSNLLYESPVSPAFNADNPTTETQILINENNWSMSGGSALITIPSGAPTSATWKVVYGFKTERIIPQGQGFEAYPNWTPIEPGYAACAPDTFRWFEQAMQKAIQYDDRPGMAARWQALQLAMRRTAVRGQAISDLREVFQLMPGFDPIPVKGAPDGMYCFSDHPLAQGPTSGGDPNWKGYNFWSRTASGAIRGDVPGDPFNESTPIVAGKFASATWTSMYIGGGLFNPVTLTVAGVSRSASSSADLTALVASINNTHPSVTATLYTQAVGGGSEGENYTIIFTAREMGAAGNNIALSATSGTLSSPTLLGGVTPSGGNTSGFHVRQVQIGRGFTDTWRTATGYQEADQYLWVRVSASRKPDAAKNELFLVYVSSTMAYDENTRWYADVGALAGFTPSDSALRTFYLPRSAFRKRSWGPNGEPVWGATLPAGTELQNFGVMAEMAGSYSMLVGQMRLVASTAEATNGAKMPYFPGALPFAINADLRRQMFVGWNGSPFHGYQLPDFWWWLAEDANVVHPTLTVADLPIPNAAGALTFPITATVGGVTKPKNALLMEQQLLFLRDAQAKYAADGGPSGFFAHTFVLNTPARASLGNPRPHSWVYVNDDPNTRWVGYQTRIVESLAELMLLTSGHAGFAECRSLALSMADAWLTRLNVLWPDLNGKVVNGVRIYGMPTDFPDPRISAPQTLYEEPHAVAHIMRACLTLRKAGVGNAALHNALITRCWNYLEMLWRTSGEMRYTWSPDPAKKQWYGFWHGDILTLLSLMLDNSTPLPAGISRNTVSERLVLTREWIETWGVGTLSTNAAAGLTDVYRDFHVLTRESDWTDRGTRGQQRLLDTFDTGTGTPEQFDTAKRPFPTQQHHWVLDGYPEHARFYNLLDTLRGRAVPVWVPSWMDDMRLVATVSASATSMQIARCGFTLAGGPRPEREDIMIETVDGRRFYRRIKASAAGPRTEVIQLDNALGVTLAPEDVLRICFISLMRLDHDSIEVNHITDSEGVSEVSVTFRAAPNTRVPDAAFYEV